MSRVPLSVLDVIMIQEGRTVAEALSATVRLARRAEELGYRRVWYAEHHATASIADVPPPVMIAHVAAGTSTIRVGSGGVLVPNHPVRVLAEQFGALGALHPGRIDLGMGRGPGTYDERVARMLRRGAPSATPEEYDADVAALVREVGERPDAPEPWLLSSSTAGAALAASLGLPMAFAHHLRPDNTAESVERYRSDFRPSPWCEAPRVMLSVHTVCAETDERAAEIARPAAVLHLSLSRGDGLAPLPSPERAAQHVLTAQEEAVVAAIMPHVAQGSPETVDRSLTTVAERYGADELMLTTPVYDEDDRRGSLELVAAVRLGDDSPEPRGDAARV